MVTPAVDGIDLFKIAGRSISGWIPSFKAGVASPTRQPFCSQLEERLLLWLEYNPQVVSYARGDIGPSFAATYRLPLPKDAPFTIGYTFEGKPHDYLPDVVGKLSDGKLFIAEAGMEDDKRGDRNLAKAEAARRLARLQRGRYWIGTEKLLTQQRRLIGKCCARTVGKPTASSGWTGPFGSSSCGEYGCIGCLIPLLLLPPQRGPQPSWRAQLVGLALAIPGTNPFSDVLLPPLLLQQRFVQKNETHPYRSRLPVSQNHRYLRQREMVKIV